MVAVVQTPAAACNIALVRMGYSKGRIGTLYEGSHAAKQFLDIYGQTRDELLRSFDWGFARRDLSLTLLKSAPVGGYIPPTMWNPAVNPPISFLFEYAYPSDCLKERIVKSPALFGPNFDPQPYLFSVANDDAYTPPQRVILTNVPNAIMVYTGQVTDPTTWDVGFVESFAAALARRAALALVGLEPAKFAASDEQISTAMAELEQG